MLSALRRWRAAAPLAARPSASAARLVRGLHTTTVRRPLSRLVTATTKVPVRVPIAPLHSASTAKAAAVAAPLTAANAVAAAVGSAPASATSSTVASAPIPVLPYAAGDAVPGTSFRCVDVQSFAEFHLVVYQFVHTPTGAVYLHLSRADSDNAFCVSVRTPPTDSTGVPHILEHTTLCGSARYPVRDPFFLLTRRSLKTFMNAMTAHDHTMYPFSTQNERDFDNLMSVYLDAVFFPNLKLTDFRQEGHRLELEPNAPAADADAHDTDSKAQPKAAAAAATGSGENLVFKGVVFNEMKGAMGDTNALFAQRLMEHMFPDNTYHYNSGGEPSAIPSLTHEQLRAFHAAHYHPSNACFLSYGTFAPRLAQCDAVCNKFKPLPAHTLARSAIAPPKPWTAPKTVHLHAPEDPMTPDPEKQTRVSVAFMTPLTAGASEAEREQELFALQVLAALLVDSPLAPMYKALIDSNIGSGFAPQTGVETSTTTPWFAFGLQGVRTSDVDTVTGLIDATLRECAHLPPEPDNAQHAFSLERLEAIVHQLEVSLKHVDTGFGMGLVQRITGVWAHTTPGAPLAVGGAGGWPDPLSPLRINTHIQRLKAAVTADPQYFQKMIRAKLLGNAHRLTMVMTPDTEFTAKESAAEQKQLMELRAKLTDADAQALRDNAAELKRLQETPPNAECLPTLRASDINRVTEHVDVQSYTLTAKGAHTATPIFWSHQPTNGVAYFTATIDLKARRLPERLRPYLRPFALYWTELGAGAYDFRALSHQLELYTGGLGMSVNVQNDIHSVADGAHHELLVIRGRALARNVPHLFRLTTDLLRRTHYHAHARLEVLAPQTAADLSSSLTESGSEFARLDAAAHLNRASRVSHELGGIPHVQFWNSLVANGVDAPALGRAFQEIADIVFADGVDRMYLIGDEPSLKVLKDQVPSFLADSRAGTSTATAATGPSSSSSSSIITAADQLVTPLPRTFYALPVPVNHVALCTRGVAQQHADSPALLLASQVLSFPYLHREIREKGGAYGAGLSSGSDGVIAFSSYRDPNVNETVRAFERAAQWIANPANYTDSDVEQALLSAFADFDSPVAPSQKGMGFFFNGLTTAMRQSYRDRLLATTRHDIARVAAKYLSPDAVGRDAAITVVGDQNRTPSDLNGGAPKWTVKPLEMAGMEEAAEEGDGPSDGEDAEPARKH